LRTRPAAPLPRRCDETAFRSTSRPSSTPRDGPLGSRQFRRPELGVAFARGLGRAACVKHFPGLGSAAYSTDVRPHVDARVRARDLAPFRAAIRAGVPCVMVGHAFYRSLGRFRASLEPKTYRLLRSLGFRGVAITDSLSIVRTAPIERWVAPGGAGWGGPAARHEPGPRCAGDPCTRAAGAPR